MNDHVRTYPQLSACGLNCGLCPRYHTDGPSRCPGCSGESFFTKRPSCGVISCCIRHDNIEYCYLCPEYPCAKYDDADEYDSFITHKNMFENFDRIKKDGLDTYQKVLNEKIDILEELLSYYNDGRRKSFYCLAVNLLSIDDVRAVMEKVRSRVYADDDIKEKAAAASGLFQEMADACGVNLKLRKKKK